MDKTTDPLIANERALAALAEAVGAFLANQRPASYDALERAYHEARAVLAT